MKSRILRITSLCLILAFAFSIAAMPVGALAFDKVEASSYVTYRTGANGVSSYYKSSKYYQNLTSIPITGDGRRDALAVALSQVGYTEGDYESGFSGTTGGSTNYTEFNYNMGDYGSGYGGDYSWCASFVAFAIYQSQAGNHGKWSEICRENDGDYTYIWRELSCYWWSKQLRGAGYFQYSAANGGNYVPTSGDLIFFGSVGDESHIGMVVYSNGSTVWTIEGNTSDSAGVESNGGGAYFKSYSLTSSSIAGYGVLPYKTADVPELDYSGVNPTTGIYMAPSGAKSVYAEIEDSTASWTLPKYSMFEVLDVDYDSDGVLMLYSKCEINGSTVYGWIVNGSETNGQTRTVQIYANEEKTGIESEVYEITEDNKVKGISVNTTVSDLLKNVTTEGDVKVYNGNTELSANAKLATGMEVDLISEGEVVATYTIVVKGDVNCDGKVNGFDYIIVKRHILNTRTLTGVTFDAGAVLNGKKINAFDYIMIKRYVLGEVAL